MGFSDFLVGHQYRGKLTIVSSADKLILDVARTFAVQSGLQLVGAFPKEAVTPALLGADQVRVSPPSSSSPALA
jgi:hypothetical protein